MRKRLFVFLSIICIALAGFVIGVRMRTDREGPKIIFSDDKIVFRDDMTNEDLLKGVKAEDAVEGDVTDTLTVESVYPVDEETAIAVYVAKDSKNNITKVKREMQYEESTDTDEKNNDDDQIDPNKIEEEEKNSEEENVTSEVTDAPEKDTEKSEENEPEISPLPSEEPQAATEEEAARTEQETLAAQMPAQSPRIYLTDYLIRIKSGEQIDKLSYVKEIQDDVDNVNELWHYIQVDGTLDVNTPGTYELKYYVTDSNNNISNTAVLKVIVE